MLMNNSQRFLWIFLLNIFLIFFFTACSSSPSIQSGWIKTFGGKEEDLGLNVRQATDGGYIVCGSSYDKGAPHFYLLKTDAQGKELWSNSFGGRYPGYGSSVQQTADGSYIVTGGILSTDRNSIDVILLKTDIQGKELWNRTFGGPSDEAGFAVQQTTDGGYVIVGSTSSFGKGGNDVYLLKTDSEGRELWNRTFGGPSDEEGIAVQQTTDGGYVIVGSTSSFGQGGKDVYLIKTDSEGRELWNRTFGGPSNEEGNWTQQTSDGGYVIVGNTDSFGGGGTDVYFIKIDAERQDTWIRTFGEENADVGLSGQQTNDGGYILCGYTFSFGKGGQDVLLIKTDSDGKVSSK